MSSNDDRIFTEDGLVVPRKLVNPSLESREKKDLHKEMLWKMKYGSNDSKDCEYRKAYKNYQQRVRNKELELESSKRMTFEKLLEEQRHRLHSVGGKCPDNGASGGGGEVYFDENVITTPHDDLPTTPAATTGGVSGGGTSPPNDEFYRVFSRVRSKSHSNSETSDEAAQRN